MAWVSFDAFPNFLHWRSQKTGLTSDHIWLFGDFCYTKSLENFSCSFIQNLYNKSQRYLEIAIKVLLLVSKVWY